MGATDKARNMAEDLGGKAKEAVGDLTDNERLEAEGQRDQAEADLKQRGEQLKDAGEDVKDAFRG
ncbi:CsbD family protein [Intrasporangium calvum]|uniref:CsbD family protein n=1 Tax=Intrasporangium calvum TaxID=53358 RepID=A0ABT5GIA8_9MICO|nr:CsbD family protein [Intrasporangium calvum]MDC5697988.1 CsbD family protein [Intrasporangium calvum]